MIFALFKKSKHFWFSWFSATKIEQHKTKKRKRAENPFPTYFLFSSANFFFDLRVNNRVVVIINYPQKVKKQKKHSLINRNKQRKNSFSICLHLISAGEKWESVSHTDKNSYTHTHRNIKDLFIKFEVVERKSTHTKYQLSEISSPTVKPFKPIKYTHTQTQTDKKSNGFSITHTTSRSFIIITITLSLFVTVKCIGYIYKRYVSVVVINKLLISNV